MIYSILILVINDHKTDSIHKKLRSWLVDFELKWECSEAQKSQDFLKRISFLFNGDHIS